MTRSLERVTGVVLAGGFGTRLQKVVKNKPKALAEVSGKPFLAYLLEKYQDAGIRETVLCTGYLATQIEEAFGDHFGDMALTYSKEQMPLGTAGALANALPFIGTDTALVANGDCFFEADITNMYMYHLGRGSDATILLTHVDDVARFGMVDVDAVGAVEVFREKGGTGPGWINAGVYLIERHMIKTIPTGRSVSIEKETFPSWIGKGLCAWKGKGSFLDIGTAESYARAEAFVSN